MGEAGGAVVDTPEPGLQGQLEDVSPQAQERVKIENAAVGSMQGYKREAVSEDRGMFK